jgi:hypothetical protein
MENVKVLILAQLMKYLYLMVTFKHTMKISLMSIFQYLTKELLLSKEQTKPLLPEVKNAFDNYIKTCINYFKTIDSNDIIQEDYKDFLCDVNELDEDTVMDTVMDTITDTKENPDNYLIDKKRYLLIDYI